MAVWTELIYLHYPSSSHLVRLMMGAAVGIGFFSHLLLDEICSVDLKGARLNKAFGTAMKFWAPSVWSTLAMYAALSALTYQVIQQWPDDPLENGVQIKMPSWPSKWPRPSWLPLSGGSSAPGVIRDRPDLNSRDLKARRGASGEQDWLTDFQDLPLSQENPRTAPNLGPKKRRGD
jgi:hypothetical protein